MMADIYKARWEAAKNLVLDFKRKCIEEGADAIMCDGDIINLDQLVVDENEIYILHVSEGSRFIFQLFENTKEYDHGLHNTIKEFRDKFLSSVKAYKQIKI